MVVDYAYQGLQILTIAMQAPALSQLKDYLLAQAQASSPWTQVANALQTPTLIKSQPTTTLEPGNCQHPFGLREYTAGKLGKVSCCDVCNMRWQWRNMRWIPVAPKGSLHHSRSNNKVVTSPTKLINVEEEPKVAPSIEVENRNSGDAAAGARSKAAAKPKVILRNLKEQDETTVLTGIREAYYNRLRYTLLLLKHPMVEVDLFAQAALHLGLDSTRLVQCLPLLQQYVHLHRAELQALVHQRQQEQQVQWGNQLQQLHQELAQYSQQTQPGQATSSSASMDSATMSPPPETLFSRGGAHSSSSPPTTPPDLFQDGISEDGFPTVSDYENDLVFPNTKVWCTRSRRSKRIYHGHTGAEIFTPVQ